MYYPSHFDFSSSFHPTHLHNLPNFSQFPFRLGNLRFLPSDLLNYAYISFFTIPIRTAANSLATATIL